MFFTWTNKKTYRILVVGLKKAGKTSLGVSLLKAKTRHINRDVSPSLKMQADLVDGHDWTKPTPPGVFNGNREDFSYEDDGVIIRFFFAAGEDLMTTDKGVDLPALGKRIRSLKIDRLLLVVNPFALDSDLGYKALMELLVFWNVRLPFPRALGLAADQLWRVWENPPEDLPKRDHNNLPAQPGFTGSGPDPLQERSESTDSETNRDTDAAEPAIEPRRRTTIDDTPKRLDNLFNCLYSLNDGLASLSYDDLTPIKVTVPTPTITNVAQRYSFQGPDPHKKDLLQVILPRLAKTIASRNENGIVRDLLHQYPQKTIVVGTRAKLIAQMPEDLGPIARTLVDPTEVTQRLKLLFPDDNPGQRSDQILLHDSYICKSQFCPTVPELFPLRIEQANTECQHLINAIKSDLKRVVTT